MPPLPVRKVTDPKRRNRPHLESLMRCSRQILFVVRPVLRGGRSPTGFGGNRVFFSLGEDEFHRLPSVTFRTGSGGKHGDAHPTRRPHGQGPLAQTDHAADDGEQDAPRRCGPRHAAGLRALKEVRWWFRRPGERCSVRLHAPSDICRPCGCAAPSSASTRGAPIRVRTYTTNDRRRSAPCGAMTFMGPSYSFSTNPAASRCLL